MLSPVKRYIHLVFALGILIPTNEDLVFAQTTQSTEETETTPSSTSSLGETKQNPATANKSLEELVVTDIHDFAALGNKAYSDGLYDMAEKMYAKYWEKANDQDLLIDAAVNLTKSKLSQNKIEEAMSVLQGVSRRNRELYPDPNSEYHKLSKENYFTLNFWIGQLLFRQGNLDAATSIYSEIISESSSPKLKTKASLGLAECYIGLKNWQQAEIILNQILESSDDDAFLNNAYIDLIQVAIAKKDFDRADTLINSRLDEATDNFRLSLEMMQIVSLLAQNKNSDAFSVYRHTMLQRSDYLKSNSNYPILRKLGLNLLESQNYDSATNVFERMLPLLKNEYQRKEILLDLAKVHDTAGQHQSAIQHYLRYVELYENDDIISKIRLRIARLFEEEQDFDQALDYFLKLYKAETDRPEIKYEAAQKIAWINKNHKKDYEKAIKYFFESSTLDVSEEEKAKGLFFAAETYFLLEDFNNAAIYYQSIPDSHKKTSYAEEARFKQAQARFNGKRFRMAAEAFTHYSQDWPRGEFIKSALLGKGVSERFAGDYTLAIKTLKSFIKKFPSDEETPQALLEASQAAAAADLQPDAIDFLTRIVKNHQDSEKFPYALYRRAYLQLSYGFYAEAREDSFMFLEKFSDSHPELAADVYLWLADHFSNNQDYTQAEHLFMEVVRRYRDLDDAPVALYEAAKCAFSFSKIENSDNKKALKYIEELLSNYPNAPTRVLAQAKYLRGDIASINGDFEDAAKWFKACAKLVPRTDLYYAAMGRIGECYYSIATIKEEPKEDYETALSYFNAVIDGNNVKHSLVEMAQYRAGKIYELLNQPSKAKDEYFKIFFKYDHELKSRKIFHWYYFARAGFDLARLYEKQGEYTSAKTIYNRLATSNIPVAEDARVRAEELEHLYLEKVDQ